MPELPDYSWSMDDFDEEESTVPPDEESNDECEENAESEEGGVAQDVALRDHEQTDTDVIRSDVKGGLLAEYSALPRANSCKFPPFQ